MKKYFENLARALLDWPYEELSQPEQRVIRGIGIETPILENPNEKFGEQLRFSERFAGQVAAFGESWSSVLEISLKVQDPTSHTVRNRTILGLIKNPPILSKWKDWRKTSGFQRFNQCSEIVYARD